jgi:hypothetical protein
MRIDASFGRDIAIKSAGQKGISVVWIERGSPHPPIGETLLPNRPAGPEHDDFRADRRAVVEIDDVVIGQADAA